MKSLFRGFCRNENGKETIYLNGEEVKGDWVYGNLFQTEKWANILTVTNSANEKSVEYEQYKVIPETVSEALRGLTDKNGRQVFEHDLIKGTITSAWNKREITCEVRWKRDGFIAVEVEGWAWEHKILFAKNCEVIGTKWDKGE